MIKINGGSPIAARTVAPGGPDRVNVTMKDMALPDVVAAFGAVETLEAEGLSSTTTYCATRSVPAEIVSIYRQKGGGVISIVLEGIAKEERDG